jgi:hypothetical protein
MRPGCYHRTVPCASPNGGQSGEVWFHGSVLGSDSWIL